MIFYSNNTIEIPQIDILSFLFNETPFHEDDPIWLCPNDPSLFINLSQARLLTGHIGYGLRSLGIGTNFGTEDIVLTFVENQVMVAPTMFGVICAGGVHSTCPVTATAFELCRQIRLSSPKILICSMITRAVAEEAIHNSGLDVVLLVMKSQSGACDVVDQIGKSIMCAHTLEWRRITSPEILERETACLVFSSGTTGIPKGVRITHLNLVANILQQSFYFSHFAQKSMKDGSYLRMPGIMQNAVVIGITVQSMMALQSGMQVYMFPKFDFPFLRRCLTELDLTVLFLVPAIWNRIANECSAAEIAHVRFCMSGASPLPVQVQKKVEAKLPPGVHLRVNWGMTETTTAASQPTIFEHDNEGSAGRLLPNISALILGENGRKLDVGEAGELCVKGGIYCTGLIDTFDLSPGPNIIKEYFQNPEATKYAFTSDGWFRTGDISYFSNDGKLFIVGRSKELLKYKSHQISPSELEAVLGQCPGVADAGVVGVSDGQGNDLPRAYIVPQSTDAMNLTGSDITEFLNARVSAYKRLRGGVAFVHEIPRNVNGKIMRNIMKEWVDKDSTALRSKL